MTDAERALLETIGLKGATRDKLVHENTDFVLLDQLIHSGFARSERTVLHETAIGALAAQAPDSFITYYLTPSGAEATGLDPWRIGLA